MSSHSNSDKENVRLGEVKEILSEYCTVLEQASQTIDKEKSVTQEDISQSYADLETIVAKNIPLYDEDIAQSLLEDDTDLSRVLRKAEDMYRSNERDRETLQSDLKAAGLTSVREISLTLPELNSEKDRLIRSVEEGETERSTLLDENASWLNPIREFNQKYPEEPITLSAATSSYPKAGFFVGIFLLAFNPQYRRARSAVKKLERADGSLNPVKVEAYYKFSDLNKRIGSLKAQCGKTSDKISKIEGMWREHVRIAGNEQLRKSTLSSVVLLPLLHKAVARAMFDQKRFIALTQNWKKKDASDALSCIVRYTSLSRMKEYLGSEQNAFKKQQSGLESNITKLNKGLRTSRGRSMTIPFDRKQIRQALTMTKARAAYCGRNSRAMRASVRSFSGATYDHRTMNSSASDSSSFWMWMWIMNSNSGSSNTPSQGGVDHAFARDALKVNSLDAMTFPEVRDMPTSGANILPDIQALSNAGDHSASAFLDTVMSGHFDIPTDMIGSDFGAMGTMPNLDMPVLEIQSFDIPTVDIPTVDVPSFDCGSSFISCD